MLLLLHPLVLLPYATRQRKGRQRARDERSDDPLDGVSSYAERDDAVAFLQAQLSGDKPRRRCCTRRQTRLLEKCSTVLRKTTRPPVGTRTEAGGACVVLEAEEKRLSAGSGVGERSVLARREASLSVGHEFGEFADEEPDFVDEAGFRLLGARSGEGGRGGGGGDRRR